MIKEIQAKVLLSHVKPSESWFGLRYNMNLYRGCEHQCIYCDSRSECYQIEDFSDVLVKSNAIELLRKELASKRRRGTIATGSMNDPYTPAEVEWQLTGQALELIAEFGFPVSVFTKSDMIVRDLDALCEINAKTAAFVSFSIATIDDELARILEPGAPSPSRRFAALEALSSSGIRAGVAMMPILPFLEDSEDNIAAIVARARACGAEYILPGFGLTMRDRQRAHFYEKLDAHFPGLRPQYEQEYGQSYQCPTPNARRLEALFDDLCAQEGIATRSPCWVPDPEPAQLALF